MAIRLQEIANALNEDEEGSSLDPLRARVKARTAERSLRALQRELAEEMASSLGRAERRIRTALEQLAALERRIDSVDPGDDAHPTLVREFNAKRLEALRFVRDLKIQREALGFRLHGELERAYPVPPPMKGR